MSYIDEVLNDLKTKYYYELEFIQACEEILKSLELVINKNEDYYRSHKVLEVLTNPDRIFTFKVVWYNDKGEKQVNLGYRVQWNNNLGPYKGGLRLHPSVNTSILKFLAFEQTFKNALTTLPLGGAKGGSDFDPKGKSDNEIRAFCQAFMSELYKYIGNDIDVPAGDIGVGSKEISYLFAYYKKLTNLNNGVLTGKGVNYGGALCRTEATGYGLVYITCDLLKYHNLDIKDKIILVTGSGNVALNTIKKALELGAKVISASDSSGYIIDYKGIDLKALEEIKLIKKGRIKEYLNYHKDALYSEHPKDIFKTKCDIILPCATQNEIDLESAVKIVENKVIALCEGANMPTTNEAVNYLIKHNVLYLPGKASNAGGVATSGIEMMQNSIRKPFTFEEVDNMLKDIMHNIFNTIILTSKEYNLGTNYLIATNIAAFEKLVDTIIDFSL